MKQAAWVLIVIVSLALAGCGTAPAEASNTTPAAQTYIQDKGSDTIVNLALAWAEKYQNLRPDVRLSVTGGGSGTGITALLSKTVDIANASRKIKDEERAAAEANGIDPVEFIIARDAIAVIVNPANPVQQLTLQQISAIYRGEINNWADVGGEDRPIVRLSRESNSGTHVYFLETVIRLGSKTDKSIFAADTLLLPSSEGIIAEVSDNPNAIGYDGLGYITNAVKVLAVAANPGETYVMPSVETVNNGTYPVARDLYMYTAGQPQGEVKTYLDWILSPEGQAIVSELGFVPVRSN